jgi:hypothetical protein
MLYYFIREYGNMILRVKYHVMVSAGPDKASVSLRAFSTQEEAEEFRNAHPAQAWIEVEQSQVPSEAAPLASYRNED